MGLNDIVSDPNELEHFKVSTSLSHCVPSRTQYVTPLRLPVLIHTVYRISLRPTINIQMFLNERKAAQHLMCWMEIEAFRGIPSKERHLRDLRARQLREKYFTRQYLLGPKSPAGREAQRQVLYMAIYY